MNLLRLMFFSILPAVAIEPCQLLVATRALGDPNFSKTVILVAEVRPPGVLGLVLNRSMRNVPLSRVFAEAKKISDPVYFGGPVDRGRMVALSRDSKAKAFCGNIQLLAEDKQLNKVLDSYPGASQLRIYAGYAGWGKGQLENEIRLGGWSVAPFQAVAVFDAKPGTLWERLIANTETMLARLVLFRSPSSPL